MVSEYISNEYLKNIIFLNVWNDNGRDVLKLERLKHHISYPREVLIIIFIFRTEVE